MAVKIKLHKGEYWAFINFKGQRKAKRIGSKHAANEFKTKLEAKIALGQFAIEDEKPRRPFDPYFRNWLNTYVRGHCKERTLALYEQNFRCHLLPHFGQTDISAITREAVKALAYTMLANGKSRNTVKAVLAPLREMFNHAIEDGHVGRNPCLRILRDTRQEKGEQQQKINFLTRQDLAHLLRTCQEHFPAHFPLVLLLARTGVRLGEALALQWPAIDFNGRFIEVRHTLFLGKLTSPKSGQSRRVDMSVQLADTLKALLLERKKETLRHGWREVPPWVFIGHEGTPLDANNLRARVWQKLPAKAGLRQLRIHDLRHTFASLLIQNGESLAYVKEQMGHHSIQITVDTYGHLVPGGNRQAVDRLDDPLEATIRNPDATSERNAVP